jgi:hypothetical protein
MIRSEWIVASTTARNALIVTDGDVAVGAEAKVLATGLVYRAVASGSGASCWDAATKESGSFTPSPTAGTNVTTVTGSAGFYQQIGDIVSGSALCTVTPTGAGAIDFTIAAPVGTVGTAYGVSSEFLNVTGGFVTGDGGALKVTAVASSADAALITAAFWYQRA